MSDRPVPESEAERLLVLLLDETPSATDVRRALRRAGRPTAVRVVAPAHVDLLHWYATDESDAWDEAADRARRAATLVPDATEVRWEAGEADPVMAVEDALQDFPADEVMIVGDGGADGELVRSLRGLGVPVTRLADTEDAWNEGSRIREIGRGVMSGRSDATPYAILVGAMLALGAVAVAILVIGLVVRWVV